MCGFVWSVVGGGWLWSVVVGGDWWCLGGGGGCCIYIYCKYISIYIHNRRVVNSFFDYDYRYLHSETSASPAYCCYISCIFFSSQCKVATDFLQHLGVPLKVTIISAAQGVDGIAFLAGMYGSAPKQKISGEISGGFSRWNFKGERFGSIPGTLAENVSGLVHPDICSWMFENVKKCWKGAIATCFCVQHVVLFV